MLEVELDYGPAAERADILSGRPCFAFLDSAGDYDDLGRYSFIGIDPFGTFHVRDGMAFWDGEPCEDAPLAALRGLLKRFRLERTGPFPFRGGVIGHISYDFGRRLETLAEPADPLHPLDELRFGFYDLVIAFDHRDRRCVLFSSGFPEEDETARGGRAGERAEEAQAWLKAGTAGPVSATGRAGEWRSDRPAAEYEAAVRKVQDYILAGDIYQANIAQRFTAALDEGFDPWAFYCTLRTVNPAPFAAFLRSGSTAIVSSSPERFLACRDGAVEARPIKGTARRAADPARDAEIAARLLASDKDRAENTMIVDLLRNDLSRVCAPATVRVPMLCGLESYEGLHHLTSVVTGRLRAGCDAVDLIAACFPGGSITGAPKLRAMDIITEIEGAARGVYCGAIGYIGFDGDLDLNIAIRTVTLEPGRACFSVGGGITLLSDPAQEYAETLTKAQRIFEAFRAFSAGGAG
ncbi:aminodeoxychorismate synthase component I [Rhizobiaceae bacterium BDR2-2]|uniref:aminodeoxychorismate synthase n=1 Tax=Ectorhizobium quercum TaxID=2965071 RepID=A0AAE3N0X0_9HYPH|nr:aminodeoxychorismate synthase component I [Ectorhizobium quercum]MCX8998106.1 aminodeoxychorismate synthase component I [Ectorhizobium quercum]